MLCKENVYLLPAHCILTLLCFFYFAVLSTSSKNGSPVEAGPVRGAFENDGDTYIVATVTKKKRRPSGGAANKQGQEEEKEESVMEFGIDVGGGEYISLQDATVATQLDPVKKNAALFQLQQLKEQVDTVMKNLQINNSGESKNEI
jgi:hypothetical protein